MEGPYLVRSQCGRSGVSRTLEPGSSVRGTPALPYMVEQRITALRNRLPELFRRVDALEAQLRGK